MQERQAECTMNILFLRNVLILKLRLGCMEQHTDDDNTDAKEHHGTPWTGVVWEGLIGEMDFKE